MAVVVEVGDREGSPVAAEGAGVGVDGGAEAARTVAEQHADGIGAGVRRGKVEVAVVVEVGRHHRLGVRADGEARGRAEAGREAVFQEFEVRPIRRGSKRATSPVMALAPARCQGGAEVLQPTGE